MQREWQSSSPGLPMLALTGHDTSVREVTFSAPIGANHNLRIDFGPKSDLRYTDLTDFSGPYFQLDG